jgi:hypothetical protein
LPEHAAHRVDAVIPDALFRIVARALREPGQPFPVRSLLLPTFPVVLPK